MPGCRHKQCIRWCPPIVITVDVDLCALVGIGGLDHTPIDYVIVVIIVIIRIYVDGPDLARTTETDRIHPPQVRAGIDFGRSVDIVWSPLGRCVPVVRGVDLGRPLAAERVRVFYGDSECGHFAWNVNFCDLAIQVRAQCRRVIREIVVQPNIIADC
jgi:hypothetical protein